MEELKWPEEDFAYTRNTHSDTPSQSGHTTERSPINRDSFVRVAEEGYGL